MLQNIYFVMECTYNTVQPTVRECAKRQASFRFLRDTSTQFSSSCRSRWSRGYHTHHKIRGSLVQTRPGSMDFFFQSVKILIITSFGREVKPWVPCRRFRHVKEPEAEIKGSEQNLLDFSRSL